MIVALLLSLLFTARINTVPTHSVGVFVIERADTTHAYAITVQQLLSAIGVPALAVTSAVASPPSLAHVHPHEVCQRRPLIIFCVFSGLDFMR
jgi:hypothetical protein